MKKAVYFYATLLFVFIFSTFYACKKEIDQPNEVNKPVVNQSQNNSLSIASPTVCDSLQHTMIDYDSIGIMHNLALDYINENIDTNAYYAMTDDQQHDYLKSLLLDFSNSSTYSAFEYLKSGNYQASFVENILKDTIINYNFSSQFLNYYQDLEELMVNTQPTYNRFNEYTSNLQNLKSTIITDNTLTECEKINLLCGIGTGQFSTQYWSDIYEESLSETESQLNKRRRGGWKRFKAFIKKVVRPLAIIAAVIVTDAKGAAIGAAKGYKIGATVGALFGPKGVVGGVIVGAKAGAVIKGAYASAKAGLKVNKAAKCITKDTFWKDASGNPGAFHCFVEGFAGFTPGLKFTPNE
jgi:hypothetical protein